MNSSRKPTPDGTQTGMDLLSDPGFAMPQDLDLVVLTTPATAFEAKVILAVLEDAGVAAYGASGLLMDEFAMSQALMNVGTEIRVRAADRESAAAALAGAKKAGELLDQEGFDPGPPAGS
jgi:hypothetical protein